MLPRHPVRLPRAWLMTDSRMGEDLWTALDRLPRGAGVVFRHYDAPDRAALWARVLKVARQRGLILVAAGGALPGGHGVHNSRAPRGLLQTCAVHDRREARAATQARVDVVFVSPVFATRSHPGGRKLGASGFARLARILPMPAVALGGMNAQRFKRLRRLGAYGWAGIDAWLSEPSGAVK